MSKKQGKGKKEKFELLNEEVESELSVALEISYLTESILEYYESVGEQSLEEGDEWKKGTNYAPKSRIVIPQDLDQEIKKAFMAQIKKFQK